MTVLNPTTVKIKRNGIGRVMFEVDGEKKLLSSDEIVFIPDVVRPGQLRGVSRVEALKDNFGLAIALENYAARFFGQGTQTSGIIEYPGKLTADQAKDLQQSFDSRHKGWRRAHKTGILSNGAIYKPTSVAKDVARAFNVPPHLLGLPGTNSYASVEQNNLAWVTHCLRPIVQKLESALTPLMSRTSGGDTAFIKFTLDGLLRADIEARNKSYSTGLQAGYLTINDVRRFEDLPPIQDDSANTVRVPLANVNVESADLSATSQRVDMATKLVQVGYDPAAVLQAFGLEAIEHTGLPSVQLQATAQIDPEDPKAVYEV